MKTTLFQASAAILRNVLMQSPAIFHTYIGSTINSKGEKVEFFECDEGEHCWITYLKNGAKLIERNDITHEVRRCS